MLKNDLFGGIALLIFALNGVSCSQDLPKEQSLPAGFELQVDEDNGYTVIKPVAWTASRRTEPDGKKFLVFTSPKNEEGLESNVSVIVSDTLNKTIGEYTKDLLSSYIQLFKKFDLETRDTVRINDIKFGDFLIKFDMEERTFRMRTVYTIHNRRLYQINAIAPVQLYEKDTPVMDEIIASLTITR